MQSKQRNLFQNADDEDFFYRLDKEAHPQIK